jgi:hypothetical protein
MPTDEGGSYEIRLRGRLDARWAAWFDGLGLTHEGAGTTVIHGPVADQAVASIPEFLWELSLGL